MKNIKQKLRELRKNQTSAENIVWQEIRNRKLNNIRFNRQHPIKVLIDNEIKYFIADFYSAEKKLIIEIDGKIHDYQKEYDKLRTEIIEKYGYRVIRFTNEQVLNNIESVLLNIKKI